MEIWAALLGAVVGGILTGITSWLTLRWQLGVESESKAKEQKERVKALLWALYHEINSVWTMYMSGAGKSMDELPQKSAFRIIVPNPGEYFPVYIGNVANLGLIPDPNLREKLMNTYTIARSLMDGFKLNNQLLSEIHAIRSSRPISESGLIPFSQASAHRSDSAPLIEFGSILKAEHEKCKIAVAELLPFLREAALLN